jgi:hypothetical protein
MIREIATGLSGAAALTAVHESARQVVPHAPRVDVIGKRAIARPMRAAGYEPPRQDTLYRLALLGEVASNSLFYALVAAGDRRHALRRGLVLGAAAGLGAAFLPPLMGLGNQPHRKAPWTQLMTVGWYTLGGLAAGAAAACPRFDRQDHKIEA